RVVLAGLLPDHDRHAFDGLRRGLGAFLLLRDARVVTVLLLLEALHVAFGRGIGELLGEEEVARVAVGNVYHRAPAAQVVDVVREDHFHSLLLSVRSRSLFSSRPRTSRNSSKRPPRARRTGIGIWSTNTYTIARPRRPARPRSRRARIIARPLR